MIIATLALAAQFLKEPLQDVTGKVIEDGYARLKELLKAKAKNSPEVEDALRKLETKPDSKARIELVREELDGFEIEKDRTIARIVNELQRVLPNTSSAVVNVSINQVGRNHRAQVAGRDIINTQKHTKVVKFTPDDTHISPEQRRKITDLIKKLAAELLDESGQPNFQAAYGKLYGKFVIESYRELKKDQFDNAVSFLRQQIAINRPKLRRSNPQAYRNNLYSPIWAKQKELGWQKEDVYQFAFERLPLKKPITSLKALGPNQLKSLYEQISRQKRM